MVTSFDSLKAFFEKPVCQAGTKPLRNGIEIALYINDDQTPKALIKQNNIVKVTSSVPKKPDFSFWVTDGAISTLNSLTTENLGEIGIEILKLMAHSDPAYKITVKVHIGVFDLIRNGYLGVIPLGGPSVMKYLASKGLGNIGKIREAISKMRQKHE